MINNNCKSFDCCFRYFFSTVFSCFIKFDKFGDVLNDHFFEIQTKLIPRSEYSDCNFNKIFSTSVFFEILFLIVSISSGSAAAKIIASISFSIEDNFEGKLIILFFFFFFFNHLFLLYIYHQKIFLFNF